MPTTHQTVLFAVVQPVAGSPGSNDPLQLVRLHPDDLVTPLVPEMALMRVVYRSKVTSAQ